MKFDAFGTSKHREGKSLSEFFFLLYLPVHWGDLRCSLINRSYLQRKHLFLFCIFRYIVDSVGNWINLRVYDTDLTCSEKRMLHNASTMTRARFILDSCNTRAISHFIYKSMCALWLVNQLWFIVPENSCKDRASSDLSYKSNKPQVSMVWRLIIHFGSGWRNTQRIRKSLACSSGFTNSYRVIPAYPVVYQPSDNNPIIISHFDWLSPMIY